MIYMYGRRLIELLYKVEDVIELDFKLFPNANAPNFVWAAVGKDCISKVKDGRWDLVSISLSLRLYCNTQLIT